MERKSYRTLIIMGLIFLHLLFMMCEENPAGSDTEVPAIPPTESMMIDLSLFSTGAAAQKISSVQSQVHFGTAVLTLSIVNITVAVYLTVPAILLGAALNQDPVWDSEDGKFHWIFTAQNGQTNFAADLAGWIDVGAKKARWEMAVTQAVLQMDDFIWYDGSCNFTATEGQWMFYDFQQPQSQVPVIQIDWQIPNDTLRTLIFENVFDGNANEGDQLTYQVDGDTARVTYLDVSESITSMIVWNRVTTAGYIQLPNYHDGTPARWDENRQDVN